MAAVSTARIAAPQIMTRRAGALKLDTIICFFPTRGRLGHIGGGAGYLCASGLACIFAALRYGCCVAAQSTLIRARHRLECFILNAEGALQSAMLPTQLCSLLALLLTVVYDAPKWGTAVLLTVDR